MTWRRLLYSVLMLVLTPLFLVRLLWRSRQNPSYRQRIAERFGFIFIKNIHKPCIWLHAVSVGETIAAKPLIERLLQDYPEHRIHITTTTPTGSDTVKRLFGKRVYHSYFPYDLLGSVKRFIRLLRPDLVIIMETELWANLFHTCKKNNIPVVVFNARLSEKSFQGYQKIAGLVQETLQCISYIAARSEQDQVYFQQLGAKPEITQAVGNIKFDLTVADDLEVKGQQLRKAWGEQRLVWVAASTHVGEDEQLLHVYQQLLKQQPDLLLVLVPRHPERFDTVTALCQQTGLQMATRSQFGQVSHTTQVIVGDSMGELLLWYAAADIAFIGGSLIQHGGHNPLEAGAFDLPIVSGQYVYNFMDIFPIMEHEGGAVLVESEQALLKQMQQWLASPEQRQIVGQQASALLRRNKGVVQSLCDIVASQLK